MIQPAKAPHWWTQPSWRQQAYQPLSLLYGVLQRMHGKCKAKTAYTAPVPVVSIGNLTVGGSGKTPLVASLARYFAEQGELVAILSRGYGGSQRTPYRVMPTDDAKRVGDEPRLLADELADTSVQVWVGARRVKSAQRAVNAGATLLLLDDGFQHRQLARTVDVVVVDGEQPFGNGLLLPAGPLREPAKALRRAHAVVVMNGRTADLRLPCTRFDLTQNAATTAIEVLREQPLIAFAGIGRPEKFFYSLQAQGLTLWRQYGFADHHNYTAEELATLAAEAKANNARLVTTSKDYARLPSSAREHVTVVPVEVAGDDFEPLTKHISQLVSLARR